MKINKTNAARILDRNKIKYELIPYEVDENDLSAQHIVAQLGEDINCVFKTLVLKGDKTVDLKKAAKVSGNKNCDLIPMKDLLATTGYIRGGCSPLGMKKPFPTFFHNTVTDNEYVYVSAGVRGLQIKCAPNDLVTTVGAKIEDLIAE